MTLKTDPSMTREVTVRELGRETASVLGAVAAGDRVLITRHGNPIAVILSVEEAVDVFLAHADQFVRMRLAARDELQRLR
jgi:prevent-host-death family protein